MPDVVVGGLLGQARPDRLGPVQGLALLIDADHDRVLGRVQVQPDDIGELGFQLRVGGELETLPPPRLQLPLLPGPDDAGRGDAQLAGQQTRRPAGHAQRVPETCCV